MNKIEYDDKIFYEIPFGKGIYYICKETTEILSLAKPNYPKILKQVIGKKGYYVVGFGTYPNRKNVNIHRAMMETFVPNPNNYKIINHKDGNKLNNQLSNLEWCTQKYNNKHAINNKLRTNFGQKEVYMYSLNGEYIKTFTSLPEAAQEVGCTPSNICFAIKNKTFAKKYLWSYTKKDNLDYKLNIPYAYEILNTISGEKQIVYKQKDIIDTIKISKTNLYSKWNKHSYSFTYKDFIITKLFK